MIYYTVLNQAKKLMKAGELAQLSQFIQSQPEFYQIKLNRHFYDN